MSYDSTDRGPAPQPPGSTGIPPGTPPVPPGAPMPPAPTGPTGQHVIDSFFAAIRRLGVSRSPDRWVGGVAGGLARRFDLDPLLVRGILGVTMLMGFGLVLYGVAWALLPEQDDGRIHLEETIRGNFDIALLGAIGMVVVGSGAGDWWFSWGPFDSGWYTAVAWVLAVVAVIAILRNARSKRRATHQPGYAAPPAPAPPTGPTFWATPTTEGGTPVPTPSPAQAARATTSPLAHTATPPRPSGTPYPAPTPGTGWTGGPVPPPPGRAWTVPPTAPPTPPRPPRPVVRGPGSTVVGVVVALVLLGLAALLLAERGGYYDGPIATVVLGGGILLAGLAIILSGVRGRKSGALTALAIVGGAIAVPAVLADGRGWWDGRDRQAFSNEEMVVSSRSVAENGFSFSIGDATIDLTQVPLSDDTLVVPVSGGIGDITVIVPAGVAVSAEVSAGAGDITWDVDGRQQTSSGLGHDRSFASDALADGSDAQIALSVELGLGDITIEEN